MLAFEIVGERLERTALRGVSRAEYAAPPWRMELSRSASTASCKNALLVAQDDFRRVDFEQFLEAVVAVDDAAIEVVDVGSRVAAAFERDHRAQRRRNDRDAREEHPLGADAWRESSRARARGACASFSRSAAPAFS